MKRLALLIFLFIVPSKISFSQEVKKPINNKYLFDPFADPRKEHNEALTTAQSTHRHVIVVVGGDWSFWSRKMHAYITRNHNRSKNYQVVFINFSPPNRNEQILKELNAPKDKGYPTILILDKFGKNLFTSDTDDLKLNTREYNEDLLASFTEKWLTYKYDNKK